jgi:hypothetical protein
MEMKRLALAALILAAPAYATITSTANGRQAYVGNGATTVYVFTFPTGATTDITAVVTSSGVPIAHPFSVILNSDQITSPGGTVTFSSAPENLSAIVIQRTEPLTQGTSLFPFTPPPGKVVEKTFDATIRKVQQVDRRVADLELKETVDISNTIAGGVGAASLISPQATGSTTPLTLAKWFAHPCNVLAWGADPTGVTDSASAINAAINACSDVYIPDGNYSIGSTIDINDRNGMVVYGAGIRGFNNGGVFVGTQLQWIGNNTDPAFRFWGSAHCILRDLKITATAAHPLHTGIRFETKAGRVQTHHRIDSVYVSSDGLLGTLHYGMRFVAGSGGDANNDQMYFTHFTAGGYDTIGVDINMHQTTDLVFDNLVIGSGVVGAAGSVGMKALEGPAITVTGGGGGGHTEADFRFEGSLNLIKITNWHSEHSARYIRVYVDAFPAAPFNVSHSITIDGGSFNNIGPEPAADGQYMQFFEQGPVVITNFAIWSDATKPSSIFYDATGIDTYNFIVIGLRINTSLTNPFSKMQPTFVTGVEAITGGAGFNVMRAKWSSPDVTLTYGATIATDAGLGNIFRVTVTNNTAFTMSFPTNGVKGQRIMYRVANASGGAMGVITWTSFKMFAFVNPANGFQRTIEFEFDGFNWYETFMTATDVPN